MGAGVPAGQPAVQRGHRADGRKGRLERGSAGRDSDYLKYVQQPELARLLPDLYPNVFPNLAGLKAARADLVAILLTGLPKGVVPGFQNFTGSTQADQLRLNMAIPPAASPSRWDWSAATPPGSPTAGGCSTTW